MSLQPGQARPLSSSLVSMWPQTPQGGFSVPPDTRAGSAPGRPGYRESWLSAHLCSPDPARPGSPDVDSTDAGKALWSRDPRVESGSLT